MSRVQVVFARVVDDPDVAAGGRVIILQHPVDLADLEVLSPTILDADGIPLSISMAQSHYYLSRTRSISLRRPADRDITDLRIQIFVRTTIRNPSRVTIDVRFGRPVSAVSVGVGHNYSPCDRATASALTLAGPGPAGVGSSGGDFSAMYVGLAAVGVHA